MSGHVELVSPPFAGHLHPLLGIGVELARRGVPVTVVSTEAARAQIEAAGLCAVALRTADDATITGIAEPAKPVGANPVRLYRQFRATVRMLAAISGELERRFRDDSPAVVVADFTLPVAGMAACRQGARWLTAMPSLAAIGSVDGTPAYCGGWLPPQGGIARARDAVARAAIRGFKRAVFALNASQLRALGFSGAFRADGTEQLYSPDVVLGLGLPELELDRSWPPAVHFVGPVRYAPPGTPDNWGAPASASQQAHAVPPTQALRQRPRVLVTCGTHLADAKLELVATIERVGRLLDGVDFEMTLGGTRRPLHHDGLVRLIDYADYDQLGQYDAIVHHGGAGIVYATLRAGLPSVVIPVDYDQPDFAARLVHHDLAERVAPAALRGAAGAERLASALERALDPTPLRRLALARFAQTSKRYDGAVAAADVIEAAWLRAVDTRDKRGGVRG